MNAMTNFAKTSGEQVEYLDLRMGQNGPLIDDLYRVCQPFQYIRELCQNSIDSGATEVLFTIDGPHLDATSDPVPDYTMPNTSEYRLAVLDNGRGMSPDDLIHYMRHISESSGVLATHGNKGLGARISTLPWTDLVLMSWQNGEGCMAHLTKKPDGNYGLRLFDFGGGMSSEVCTPPEVYSKFHRENLKISSESDQTGTLVILASREGDDTLFGPDSMGGAHLLPAQINRRYYRLPPNVNVRAYETWSSRKSKWPRLYAHRNLRADKRGMTRTCRPSEYYLQKLSAASGTMDLKGAKLHWFTFDPKSASKMRNTHSYGHEPGFIAGVYQDEIYEKHTHFQHFLAFGITRSKALKRLVIIVEPTLADSDGFCGVYPDSSRSRLMYRDASHQARPLPWERWGAEFHSKMPQEVRAILDEVTITSVNPDQILDEVYDRLESLSDWYRVKNTTTAPDTKRGGNTNPRIPTTTKKERKKWPTVVWEGDKPHPTRAATYTPGIDLVCIYLNFPLFHSVYEHFMAQYGQVPGADVKVRTAIQSVYTFAIVSRIVHAKTFKSQNGWNLDSYNALLSEEALTTAVLGVHDAVSAIQAKLGWMNKLTNSLEESEE